MIYFKVIATTAILCFADGKEIRGVDPVTTGIIFLDEGVAKNDIFPHSPTLFSPT